jgi:hypothetical protein
MDTDKPFTANRDFALIFVVERDGIAGDSARGGGSAIIN